MNTEEQLKIIETAQTKILYKQEELTKKLNLYKTQSETNNDSYALDLIEKIQSATTQEELLELENKIKQDLVESVNKIIAFVRENPELSQELGLNERNLVSLIN